MGNLLIDEYPLMMLPTFAKIVGVNQALFIQQLHFLINNKEKNNDLTTLRDGYMWVYNSLHQWHEQYFYFWSKRTLQRVITKCEKENYIITTDKYNKHAYDNTKWYRINHEVIDELCKQAKKEFKERQKRLRSKARNNKQRQNDVVDHDNLSGGPRQSGTSHNNNMSGSTRQNGTMDDANMGGTRPETSTKTASETSTDSNNNKKNNKNRARGKTKKLSTTDLHPKVIEIFNLAFGSFPNSLQIDELESYGISDELLYAVIKWAGRGGHTPNFMYNQLDKLKENGISSAQDFVESKSNRKSEWDKLDFDEDIDDAWDKGSPGNNEKPQEKIERISNLQKEYEPTENHAPLIWNDTLKYIRSKLTSQSFNTWFSNVEVIGIQDNTLNIKVDNDFIEDWISSRYYNLICSCLYTLTGTKLDLHIVVQQ